MLKFKFMLPKTLLAQKFIPNFGHYQLRNDWSIFKTRGNDKQRLVQFFGEWFFFGPKTCWQFTFNGCKEQHASVTYYRIIGGDGVRKRLPAIHKGANYSRRVVES